MLRHAAILLLVFVASVGAAADPDWSVILVGDPQQLADPAYAPDTVYSAMMQWIAANKAALNIKAVIGVGDIVNGCCASQITIADSAWKVLDDAGIPWITPHGDHDLATGTNTRNPRALFDTGGLFAPAVRFQQPWYGGAKDTTGLNWYITFQAESRKIAVIALELFARPAAVLWAQEIHDRLRAQGYAVWVTTHGWLNNRGVPGSNLPGEPFSLAYYNFTGTTNPEDTAANYAMSAVDAWRNYMGKWPNLEFIFGGHYLTPKQWDQVAVTSDSARHQLVQQLYQNFQVTDQSGCAGKAPCVYAVPPAANPSNVATVGILNFRPARGLMEWSILSTNSLNWYGGDNRWHATQQILATFDIVADTERPPLRRGMPRRARPR